MMSLKSKVVFLCILLFVSVESIATHNRAGEILYEQLNDLTFEITITTYTYSLSSADRDQLDVEWGDDTYTVAKRVEELMLPDNYKRNKYQARHTFPGPGVYKILVQDPNRNYGVLNIPNSVNTVFSISTTLYVIPDLGSNTAPILLNPPINKATKGKVFIHNPGAFDADGDSISYGLTACTGEDGLPINSYELPLASNEIYIDSIGGDFIWDSPLDTGKYNIAILINEWRSGVKIGEIVRDMQIDVLLSDNDPPINQEFQNFCIAAGQSVETYLISDDADGDSITQYANGGPFIFESSPAVFENIVKEPGHSISHFYWETNCNHIRKTPYEVIVTAEDNNEEVHLVDMDKFTIQVMGEGPMGLLIEPGNYYLTLSWEHSKCDASKYEIYRRQSSFEGELDSCTMGLPSETGYELIDETTDTTYIDKNGNVGLFQGIDYCYRIVAVFEDESRSYPSEEVCGNVIEGSPHIINTSVNITDNAQGEIELKWIKPRKELDTLSQNFGPFKYFVFRSDGIWGEQLMFIDSTSNMDDTTHIDTRLLNTQEQSYSYKVILYNYTPGNEFPILHPQIASTMDLNLIGNDNEIEISIKKNTPWVNDEYTVYRLNELTSAYDSIGSYTNQTYLDQGLKNGKSYCYRVRSRGHFVVDTKEYINYNFSQIACTMPVDSVYPGPPEFEVYSACDSLMNVLTWSLPDSLYNEDVIAYKIYYSPNMEQPLDSITRIDNNESKVYEHILEVDLRGCYAMTSIDSVGNESALSAVKCIDECTYYILPNVFTPNNDRYNNTYLAIDPVNSVSRVNMKIYNKWGRLVYETEDPKINWDGTIINTNNKVKGGVYYYICDVYEDRLDNSEPRTLVGFIHVYTQETNTFENE